MVGFDLLSFVSVPVLLSLYKITKKKTISIPEKEYDFIVIGGGSAGCAFAGRLTEDPSISVLLIEAGGDGLTLDSRIPAAVGNLQHSSFDWEDYAEPQPNRACLELINGQSYWPRGKCLGGSSILNYMAYVRGNHEDYNSWGRILNDSRWNSDTVQKIFQRMENCSSISGINSKRRGMNGPVHVNIKQPVNSLANLFISACSLCGYSIGDYNDEAQECASILQTTTKFGRRYSAADAYIWPVVNERPNLHVLLHSEVTKIHFEPTTPTTTTSSTSTTTSSSESQPSIKATAIEFITSKQQKRIVHCRKEVLLAASAIGSPKLLLLSGIGPKDELEALNITPIIDSPDVGKHLEDHLMYGIVVKPSPNTSLPIGNVNKQNAENFPEGLWALFEWFFFGRGLLASSAYDTTLFLRSTLSPQLPFPDLQLGLLAGMFPRKFWIENARVNPDELVPKELLEDDAQGFILLSILLHPFSKGSITLRSNQSNDKPRIEAGYLTDERDLNILAYGVLECIRISRVMGYPSIVSTGISDLDDVEQWKKKIRQTASTLYHPSCTCAMGRVTNSNLLVKGVSNLRVIDTSVCPHIVSGNTNAPAMMIGEMAADIVRERYHLQKLY